MLKVTAARWRYRGDAKVKAATAKLTVKPRRRRHPALDVLEDRTAPAVFTVNGLGDDTNADSTLSLREAVAIINGGGTDAGHNLLSRALTSGELAEISGALGSNDTIQFTPGLNGTITLNGNQLALTNPVSIQGPGSGVLAINGNGASRVFGILNTGIAVSISGLTIAGGSGGGFGGGVFVLGGTVNLSNLSFTGNTAGTGGALEAEGGSVTVANSTFASNSAPTQGGAINNDGAAVTLSNNTFTGNSAAFGGAIFNQSTLTLSGSTLANNSAGFWGGAVYNIGTLTAINDTLNGNTAGFAGGGLYSAGGTTTLTANTISANQAGLTDGGGISADAGAVTLRDTIVAGNTLIGAPDDVDGTLVGTSAFNLIGAAGFINLANGSNGNQIGTSANPIDPLLGPLADHGGKTQTQPLLAGSPALGAGTSLAGLTTDQRGVIRGGAVNIGAFQATASTLQVSGFPSPIRAGDAGTISVSAVDSFGQVAVGDNDALTFTSTDAAASLPVGAALTAGTGSFSATLTTAATQSITAIDGAASLSGTQSGIVVTPRAFVTTTTVIAAPNPSTYGDSVSFSAAVSANTPDGSKPTGTVQFQVDGVAFGAPVVLVSGVAASQSLTTLSAGSHAITALYVNTDGNFFSGSGAVTQAVNQAPLVVTPGDATRVYGDTNPSFAGTITGLVNGDLISASFTSSATITDPIGSYAIAGNLFDPSDKLSNYAVTFNAGTLTVTPAPLTITANNAARLYGDANPAFSGTISGLKVGDAITASFASAATPTSPIGVYLITSTVSDPNNVFGNYAVTVNNGQLTVNPAPLSVTPANATRIYGDANPTFTGTVTGLKNNEVVTASYSSAATPASNIGTYAITASLADPNNVLGNYTVTLKTGNLTVTPAPLTVVVDNATRFYGDPNPALTGTITGLRNGDPITAHFATTATPATPIGTYAISATFTDPGQKLGNYAITTQAGSLTITPAPLTVSPANASRYYGDANPAFSGQVVGLKNNDNITAVYSSSAGVRSSVGSYALTATLLDPTHKLGNYVVTTGSAQLTVVPAPLSVTPANASRVYGQPNPSFTGVIAGLRNSDPITAAYSSAATPASAIGNYPISAALSEPGGFLSNYALTINTGTLSVTAAPLVVTPADASRLYGDTNPVLTGTIVGLQNGDTVTADFGTAATLGSVVGSYATTATLSDPSGVLGNYLVTLNTGHLAITPATLTVTASDATRLYGDLNPTFTGSIGGLKNNDAITPIFVTSATLISAVGTYPITAVLNDPSGSASNYTLVVTPGQLTVTPAPLSVTPADAARLYGATNPSFTGALAGLKNGDPINAHYASTATSTSAIGTYAITASLDDPSARLSNYVVQLNTGLLTVNPAPLSVTPANATRAYGGANPALTGTISGLQNGDAITATYATSAAPASPIGTYPIAASVSDPNNVLGNYVLTLNTGALTVTRASLVVSPADASRVYGSADPSFTGVITGLVNGDIVTLAFNTNETPASPVGTYTISATLSDPNNVLGNYTVTLNTGSLAITPASLTVTANDATKFYGQANPAFTASYSGFVLTDDVNSLSGQLAFATPADATSHVGSYALTPLGLTSSNYAIAYTPGSLVVTQATLIVTANGATRAAGQANPSFSASFTGFVNGDGPANLLGTLAFTTPADQSSAPGTYPIVPSGLSSTDYAITFISGTLTITPAGTLATFSNLAAPTVVFGKPHTILGGTISAGSAIPSGSVTITVQSNASATSWSFTAPIDPLTGQFSYRMTSSALAAGSYTITYAFAGNGTYGPTQATTQMLVTYSPESLHDMMVGESGDTLAVSIEVDGYRDVDVSRQSLTVSALGISPVSASSPTMPATGAAGSSTNGLFLFQWRLGDSGGYRFNLSLVDAHGNDLAPGTYKLYIQIAGDPLVHSLIFKVIPDRDDHRWCGGWR